MKNIIALLVLVGIFKAGDAAITAWTTPSIASAADGSGTLTVAEDQALSTTIETYAATSTAPITYSLVKAVTPFAVASTGELTITAALDYETATSYSLEIKAVDGADPKASGTATISVTVTDVNEAPAFAKTTYTTTIADNAAAGTTVFTTTATDQDSGDTISYSIVSGDTKSPFVIGSSTGIITINKDVTLEACAKYALEIEAKDDDSTSLTGTATLNIEVTPCSGAAMIVTSTVMICLAVLLAISL